jgi:hypothetical protein
MMNRGERAPRWTTYEQGLAAGRRSAVCGDVPDDAHVHSSPDWRRGYSDGYRIEDALRLQAKSATSTGSTSACAWNASLAGGWA